MIEASAKRRKFAIPIQCMFNRRILRLISGKSHSVQPAPSWSTNDGWPKYALLVIPATKSVKDGESHTRAARDHHLHVLADGLGSGTITEIPVEVVNGNGPRLQGKIRACEQESATHQCHKVQNVQNQGLLAQMTG
jgi:hypothetical protein